MTRFDRAVVRPGIGRELLLDVLEEGLTAVDPARCVARAIGWKGSGLRIDGASYGTSASAVRTIAVGKAAVPMVEGLSERLGSAFAGGIAVTRYGYGGAVDGVDVIEAGHPIPDENGQRAAARVGELADAVGPDDLVVCLLSGGGSALLAAPPDEVTLEALAETTRKLLASGAAIDEMNTVRRHLSRLQGGWLARRLHPAMAVTLALSDVIGDVPHAIASGPTVPDPTTYSDAVQVLRRHRLWDRVPDAIRRHLQRGEAGEIPETPKPGDPAFAGNVFRVIGNNGMLLDAIERTAAGRECTVVRAAEPLTGEAREIGRALGRRALELAAQGARRTVWLAGGETTVTVRGGGRGGRNQELALAAALEIDGCDAVAVAALASDGTDGVTDAAGALVDGRTVARSASRGCDPEAALADNDTHPCLAASDDLLQCGPTRTNVADACVVFVDVR